LLHFDFFADNAVVARLLNRMERGYYRISGVAAVKRDQSLGSEVTLTQIINYDGKRLDSFYQVEGRDLDPATYLNKCILVF
jgi:hypothetical protein